MKKLFTFVFCVLCAVSVWGAEVSVTIPESGTTTTQDFPFTISHPNGSLTTNVYRSKTQQIFLASEIGATNAGTIKSISFKSSTYATTHSDFSDTRRKLTVYMQETELSSLSSFVDYSEASQIFSAEQFAITSETTFSFDNFEFNWDGTKNILITIIDQSGSNTTSKNDKTFVGYTPPTNSRGIAQTFDYNGTASGPYSTPTVLNTIAQITFTIDASGSTTPSISTSTDALDFGSFYPAGETVSQTFSVTASNLTKDITLATTANGVTISPTSISKDNTDLTGDGVEVTVTLGSGYTFTSGTKLSITSSGASDKEVTLSATEVVDGDFYKPEYNTAFNYENSQKNNHKGYVSYSAELTISEVTENQFKPYSTAAFTVDYSNIDIACENSGKVTNLKGKFISEEVFKAFSFDYTAPEQTGIVIDEDNDNSSTWPEDAQLKDLIIKRTIVPNQWNSIVLPTRLTSTEVENIFGTNTDLEEFTSAVVTSSNITLNFTKKTNGLEAGTPYLIKPTQAIANPLNLQNHSFTKTVTPVDHDGIRFEGVLVPTLIDGGDGSDYIIVGANNTLFHPTGEGTIKGMRAYFHVVGSAAKAALKTAKVSMNTGSTTELVLVKDNQTKPYKTMVNDQIVIVNEGKQINILGQIIK